MMPGTTIMKLNTETVNQAVQEYLNRRVANEDLAVRVQFQTHTSYDPCPFSFEVRPAKDVVPAYQGTGELRWLSPNEVAIVQPPDPVPLAASGVD